MTEQLIALEFLHPNKYQPRQHEDPVVVQELAENIERNATDLDVLLDNTNVKPSKALIKLAQQWDAEIDSVAEGGAK